MIISDASKNRLLISHANGLALKSRLWNGTLVFFLVFFLFPYLFLFLYTFSISSVCRTWMRVSVPSAVME